MVVEDLKARNDQITAEERAKRQDAGTPDPREPRFRTQTPPKLRPDPLKDGQTLPFGKNGAWKKPGSRTTRDGDQRRKKWARQDEKFWTDHMDEIKARREARVAGVETTSERLARKRAAWRDQAPS